MEAVDTLVLSRLQFAVTVMFHYLFPPLTIGLGWLMVVMEGLYLRSGLRVYESIARFWTKLFAVNFALGVASGIVMEFQFGTNWSAYSRYVGDVFGSALAAEGIFAFFLESGFLAVLVFGWDRVSARMHFFSTLMVALGSTLSAVWIVVANSWQQTPAGFHIVETPLGPRAEIVDFWALVFNPSSMGRLLHVLLGALVLGAFFVLSISAWYLLKGRHEDAARRSFVIALWVAALACLAQGLSGHEQALGVAVNQPTKLLAMEGVFHEGPAPLYLFGLPDEREQVVRYGVALPGMLSWLLYRDPTVALRGLDSYDEADWPPVALTFQSYHLMIALGVAMTALALLGVLLLPGGRVFRERWLMRLFVVAVIAPFLANQAGWTAAEVGRQPWIVWGLLRTDQAFSPSVAANQVLASIILFLVLYAFLFVLWLYVLNDKIQHGPEPVEELPVPSPEPFLAVAGRLVDPSQGFGLTHTPEEAAPAEPEPEPAPAPAPKRRTRRQPAAEPAAAKEAPAAEPEAKPKRRTRRTPAAEAPPPEPPPTAPAPAPQRRTRRRTTPPEE